MGPLPFALACGWTSAGIRQQLLLVLMRLPPNVRETSWVPCYCQGSDVAGMGQEKGCRRLESLGDTTTRD